MLHAVKMLPASKDVPLIPSDDRKTTMFGWIVTLIPRVGIVGLLFCFEHDFFRKTARTFRISQRARDPYIERALAAMADMGFLEADHQRAEFRQAEPLRHLAAQHAALGIQATDLALAGDDQHEGEPVMVGALQEGEQHPMGARLGHAVQIEPRIDVLPAARQLRPLAAADRRQRRRSADAAGAPDFTGATALTGIGFCGRVMGRRDPEAAAWTFATAGRLRSGLTCFATLSQSARSSSLERTLAPRRSGAGRESARGVSLVAVMANAPAAPLLLILRNIGSGDRQRHRFCHRRRLRDRVVAAGLADAASGVAAGCLHGRGALSLVGGALRRALGDRRRRHRRPFRPACPAADRSAETVWRSSPMADPRGPEACGRARPDRALFGTSITNCVLCRSRPETFPASAPAPK